MDALPMTEQTNLLYASVHPNAMHACGHDGHTTMLLGAAEYLAEHRPFKGKVFCIFQPAEEGGNAGARSMIGDGLFEKFPMDSSGACITGLGWKWGGNCAYWAGDGRRGYFYFEN